VKHEGDVETREKAEKKRAAGEEQQEQ